MSVRWLVAQKEKARMYYYIHPTRNEAFQKNKLDKGPTFKCVKLCNNEQNEREQHHTSSDFP